MGGFQNVKFSRTHFTPHYSTPYKIERVLIHIEDIATSATIYPISNLNEIPHELLQFLYQEYNDEVHRGDTQPFFDPLTIDEFKEYWFGQFVGIMLIGDSTRFNNNLTVDDWSKRCLGSFFIKSNYPGRCSQICTMNILVNAGIRRRGIGFFLCECFLRWAPKLGYTNCLVEMVFDTNVAAKKVLDKCGFSKLGKIKNCAILKSTKDRLIDSINYSKVLTIINEEQQVSKHDQILKYLISGQYPVNFSREDKSRLRSLSYYYKVTDGKLFLKGKEVVSNVNDQYRITKEIHENGHNGINKTTSLITNKFYWSKIKSTVKKIILDCSICQGVQRNDSKKRDFRVLKPLRHAIDKEQGNEDEDSNDVVVDLPHVLTPLVSTDDLFRNLGMNFDVYTAPNSQHGHSENRKNGNTPSNINTANTNYTDELDDIISNPDYTLPSQGMPSSGGLEEEHNNDNSDEEHQRESLYQLTQGNNKRKLGYMESVILNKRSKLQPYHLTRAISPTKQNEISERHSHTREDSDNTDDRDDGDDGNAGNADGDSDGDGEGDDVEDDEIDLSNIILGK